MLPFRKNQDDGVGVGPVESIERKPDDDAEYAMLDAVAEDMMAAFKSGDVKALKAALEAFADHLQDLDQDQDAEIAP